MASDKAVFIKAGLHLSPRHENRKVHSTHVNVLVWILRVHVSRRRSKQSPAWTTDVVMDTTDENETRITLVSFSSRLRLQLMLTLKTFHARKKCPLCGFTQQEWVLFSHRWRRFTVCLFLFILFKYWKFILKLFLIC